MDLGNIDIGEIEKLVSSLSAEDMELLGSMASQLFSDGRNNSNQPKEGSEKKGSNSKSTDPFPDFSDMPIDFETIRKIAAVMNKLNSQQKDERCEFLLSLKPMLSKPRQQKIDFAISMLRIFSVLPLMNELG